MEKLPAERDHFRDYFLGALEDGNPLAGCHGEHGIRTHVDVFNQVTIDDE